MLNRLEHLLGLYESTPADPFILFALAKEYESKDDPDRALEFYLRLRETSPAYVGLYYHLGKLYETLQSPEKALEAYHQGIEVAQQANDLHAASELKGAKLNLEYEL
jgi:tetratricopeptide (TPR) repeat protein